MFTDLVAYSALAQRDEALALELLEEHRRVVWAILPRHCGREVKTTPKHALEAATEKPCSVHSTSAMTPGVFRMRSDSRQVAWPAIPIFSNRSFT